MLSFGRAQHVTLGPDHREVSLEPCHDNVLGASRNSTNLQIYTFDQWDGLKLAHKFPHFYIM